ncbi:protein ALTERED PHOSPHATE STARVATION RESPONSE 1-like isoform X2 [Actinidia eriantha]|uniref:protein ALTERED PHOSPHATE STARVATION RESPONSE 1-like isoform X2 n=1 Tax=Actinidia eriantha TaxID=165200 RepID=UPI00258FF6EB|nr:protein ALTERED PHOSPHATE STARVATION RESPONSE 1-like isoform X2 [Actinidia eriantha]
MGCTQSKIENEETVTRCKERKRFMTEGVTSRNAFAAAHSSYTVALKNTGAALSDFAHGEVHHPHAVSSAGAALPSAAQPHYDTLPPPPPPLPNYPPSPLQRAASMPEIFVHKPDPKRSDPIIEEENEDEIEIESHSLKHRRSRSIRTGGEELAPPPSPPRTPPLADRAPPPPPPPESKGMTWDFFYSPMENEPAPSLEEVDEGRWEREREEMAKRAEVEVAEAAEKVEELPPQPLPPAAETKAVKKVKQVAPAEGKREGKSASNVSLLQIFNELDDCFLKASESAHEVSKMLEANRLHYHSNFADNRGIATNKMVDLFTMLSFKGLSKADDGMEDFDSEEHETHATVLDKMLAWEKKLYDEVKAGEQMKFEYQRKVNSLNKLNKRGANTESIEKTKAALSHLHTRYIVDMQALDSTVSEINRLRDELLYPKLVSLVDGMATMWENMQIHHEKQSKIATALKFLDISQSPKETSENHHGRTLQLMGVAREWKNQFGKLMTHQKEYINALNGWLKLNLVPIDNNIKEKVSSPQRPQNPPIQALLHAWNNNLTKLPDELARTAMFNFSAVMDTIVQYQVEEMKLRNRCEDTRKELARRTRQFEDWYNKYMQRKTPPDEMDPERAHEMDLIADKRLAVEAVKNKLEEEEDAYRRQCVQVREKSLTTLKTRLPEVFQAMSDSSIACSEMYSNLRSISHPP